MNDDNRSISVKSDFYFAMIPEWILYADISSAAVRVFCTLNRYADKNGDCHPSRRTIANKAKMSLKTVDRAVKELIEIGALRVESRPVEADGNQQYRSSNLYTLLMRVGVNLTPPQGKYDATPSSDLLYKTEPLNQSQRTREIYSSTTTKSGQPAVYDSDTQKYLAGEYFDEFWKIYPRKVGKGQARTAFVKALKKGLIGEILEGCQKYAEQRAGQDPAYTAHPATWLNAERWLDEPDPTFTPKNVTRADQTDKVKAALQRLTTQQREITA